MGRRGVERGVPAGATTRRALLYGAAAAVTLSACDLTQGAAPAPSPSPSAGPLRFPGDPGDGRVYLGSSLAINEPATARPDLGGNDVGITRRFYQSHQEDLMAQLVSTDAAVGILPFVSVKTPGSWAEVASGAQDRWLDGIAERLAVVGAPVFLALHHEPENDVDGAGMTSADWVAMQQRAITRTAAITDQVTVVPVVMRWSFEARSRRDPREWLVPDTVVQGVDIYNPWDETGRHSWIPFSELIGEFSAKMGDMPVVVPEFGAASDPFDPARQALWLAEAFDTAVRSHIIGLAWFESSIERRDGFYRLDGDGRRQFRALLGRPEAAHLPVP